MSSQNQGSNPAAQTLASLDMLDGDAAATIADTWGEHLAGDDAESDPGATIADMSGAHMNVWDNPDSNSLEALERLHSALGLPPEALEAARTLDPGATVDDILGELYDRAILDKKQFVSAHAATDLEVDQDESAFGKRYKRLAFFDEGGVGEIYIAKDRVLRRKVAVKQIKRQSMSEPANERFLREAQITAQLDHPNVVPIYSYDESDEGPVSYAMKLIRGSTLASIVDTERERVEAGAEDTDEALAARLELFIKVCDAMSYAHSRRVIHRDLKPENVMVGSFGEVYVMDWGIARLVDGTQEAGRRAAGTPFYMSPEQAAGLPAALDVRSDIYTLGFIFFELCTLQRAMPGENILEVLKNAVDGARKDFEHVGGKKLPEDLKAIFNTAAAFEPEARYESVSDFADDIRRYLRGEELSVRPDNAVRKITRWIAHHRQLTLLLVLGLMLSLAAAVIWSLLSQQATIEAAQHREERLTAWQNEVTYHANDLDHLLLRISGLTQHLGRTTTTLLAHPPKEFGEAFEHDAIERGTAQAPSDFADAPSHLMKASFNEPIFDLPPGVTLAETEVDIKRLYPLRRTFQRIFLDYRERTPPAVDEAVLQSMRDELVPLRWAYIALENGLYIGYPGTLGLGDGYDSRQRPWYKTGHAGGGKVVWGTPYYGVQAGMLGLPALLAIYKDDGTFNGVVAVEVQVERLIAHMLERTEAGDVEMSLVDPEGRVITHSGVLGAKTQNKNRTDALSLEPYPSSELIQAIQTRRSGYIEVGSGDDARFIGFQRLSTLGWFYVEEIPVRKLLGE